MSVRILWGNYDSDDTTGACLVDSVTGLAFGPLFDDGDEADAFLSWLAPADARTVGDLPSRVQRFREDREASEGLGADDDDDEPRSQLCRSCEDYLTDPGETHCPECIQGMREDAAEMSREAERG